MYGCFNYSIPVKNMSFKLLPKTFTLTLMNYLKFVYDFKNTKTKSSIFLWQNY